MCSANYSAAFGVWACAKNRTLELPMNQHNFSHDIWCIIFRFADKFLNPATYISRVRESLVAVCSPSVARVARLPQSPPEVAVASARIARFPRAA